jgi:hypothetical protein
VRARAVARVTWSAAGPSVAHLHVHVAPSAESEWTDQEIAFAPQDAEAEQGRTVGYALASMVQRLEHEHPAVVEVAPPVVEQPPAPPLVIAAPEPPPPVERPKPPKRASDVDLFAEVAGALGGGATAAGGTAGVRWWPLSSFGLRAGVGARAGAISEADATTTTVFAGVGPAYRVRFDAFELGARADVSILRHVVVRRTSQARWVGAADVVFEAGWAASGRMGVLFGLGPELAFGSTEIDIGGRRVADIPTIRGVAELGLRIRF